MKAGSFDDNAYSRDFTQQVAHHKTQGNSNSRCHQVFEKRIPGNVLKKHGHKNQYWGMKHVHTKRIG
jgi:hypothetical protein